MFGPTWSFTSFEVTVAGGQVDYWKHIKIATVCTHEHVCKYIALCIYKKDIRASTYSWISILSGKKRRKNPPPNPHDGSPAMPAKPVPEDQAAKHDWRRLSQNGHVRRSCYYMSMLLGLGFFAVHAIGFSNICRIRIQIHPRNPRILE